jgi:hypothetical protein
MRSPTTSASVQWGKRAVTPSPADTPLRLQAGTAAENGDQFFALLDHANN